MIGRLFDLHLLSRGTGLRQDRRWVSCLARGRASEVDSKVAHAALADFVVRSQLDHGYREEFCALRPQQIAAFRVSNPQVCRLVAVQTVIPTASTVELTESLSEIVGEGVQLVVSPCPAGAH